MSDNIVDVPMAQQRDLRTVTAEIRTLTQQARKMAVSYIVEIGRRLKEAKSLVSHGEWGDYLKNEVEYSQSTANNYMAIFEAYAADQLTLDGAVANSQTLGNLSYTKALKLLALPEEEREEFVRENDVEAMSTRELDKLIRERDEAKQRAAELEQQVADEAALKKQLADAEAKAQKAKDAEKKAKDALKQLKENPEIPADVIDKLRAEAKAAASNDVEELERKIAAEAESAKEQARRAHEEAEELRKKLSAADPDTVAFKLCYEAVQQEFNKLHGILLRIEARDEEKAAKLRAAIAAMTDAFRKQVQA